jgi:hypothetical protein
LKIFQHTADLYQLLDTPPQTLRHLVKTPSNDTVPFLVLTRDNGEDQTIVRLANVFPYWQLMKQLDLDALKITAYCPGRSKEHPPEQGNRSLKRTLKGHVISSGTGNEEAFDTAILRAQNLFLGSTHAGEPISILAANKVLPSFLTPYPPLKAFAKTRAGKTPPSSLWYFHQVSQESWGKEGHEYQGKFYFFADLEQVLNQLQHHIVHFCIYTCFIFRCRENRCAICIDRVWKGSYDPRSCFTDVKCSSNCEDLCQHALHRDWNQVLSSLSLLTKRHRTNKPKVKTCSICKSNKKTPEQYTGHSKNMLCCPFHPNSTASASPSTTPSSTSKAKSRKPFTCTTCTNAGLPPQDCIGHTSRMLICPSHQKHVAPTNEKPLCTQRVWLFDTWDDNETADDDVPDLEDVPDFDLNNPDMNPDLVS